MFLLTWRETYFKTSYVTVYQLVHATKVIIRRFQNIVCYCLSDLWVVFLDNICHFKTSYVTVYLCSGYLDRMQRTFQNIVCYCLSSNPPTFSRIHDNFKTSYVTVYHHILHQVLLRNRHFKTSYVTVYQRTTF